MVLETDPLHVEEEPARIDRAAAILEQHRRKVAVIAYLGIASIALLNGVWPFAFFLGGSVALLAVGLIWAEPKR